MKLLRKQMLLCSILFLVFTLSACSAIGQTDENNLTDSATSAEKTVSVVRGTITPTVSTQTTIVPAVPFIISSPENGIFNTAVELEEKITAGQIIGTVNGKELKSPVDGTITSIAPSNESVPSNYPVAIVHYTGFALNVEADNFLSTLPEYAELKAKFQVYDGVGPTDMIAVVSPAADENAFTGIVPQEGILQCLISQTVDVKSGQSATVVITATTRNDVLILPLSVIAGRQGTGLVTVITPNGERVETKVTLGVTDGANIESLPEEKQYKGGRTVDELLQDMAEGKTLDDAETEYVKIFANLKDFEKAQQKAELKNDFSEDFVKDLESKGISRDELEGMQIKIESNGNVTVSGIEDKEVREQVQKLVEEKYSDRMYQYYTGIADSVGNLTSNTWQYATDVQEVRRYLKGVTGEDISLENLYLTPDGKIGGLPEKAANLINKTKDNAKIERIKDALINIIGHNRTSGDLGIPDFTSEFQFSNGAFSVADSGFTVDMAALDRRLTPQPHDNMYSDMYEYSFRKVL